MILLILNKLNINATIRAPLLSYNLTLKFSSKKISRIFRLLLIVFKISLEETHNINE